MPATNTYMMKTFSGWVRKRNGDDIHIPEVDRIVPLIAADPNGMKLGQLRAAINLERDVLDSVLNGFVRAGLLTVTNMNGVLLYRSGLGIQAGVSHPVPHR